MTDREIKESELVLSNAIRLSVREWLVVAAIVLPAAAIVPAEWGAVEPFRPGPDYRLPYSLSKDYWMFERYCRLVRTRGIPVIGDSVVWGHYVASDQTLSHCLSAAGGADFANFGVDGTHPAALAGLLEHYAGSIRGQPVILHCNLLWLSSDERDLRTAKEVPFNHPRLVPQFRPWMPAYREPVAERLRVVVGRNAGFFGWAEHLRAAYFHSADVPLWSLRRPLSNPLAAVTGRLPGPDEPPSPPPVAKPWTRQDFPPFDPPWVELDSSLQWRSFRRAVALLEGRGNKVFVLVGPLNEHMLTPASRARYQRLRDGVTAWLAARGVPHYAPPPLPSDDYADASHPLPAGYEKLARLLLEKKRRDIPGLPRAGASRGKD